MIGRMAFVASLLLVSAGAELGAAEKAKPQRFENETAGISLLRPAGWSTASVQQLSANRERVRLADKDLQEAVQKHATAPLFAFTKYPEPHDDLNPSIQVTLRPLGALASQSSVEILTMAIDAVQKAAPDFTFVDKVATTKVAGLDGAFMKAKYTISNTEGRTFKVLSRMWLAKRGSFMFLIGMSGPQEGPDLSEDEFAQVLASIKIEK